MKFYNITTNHNQDQIDDIIMSMSQAETDYVVSLYGKISMVEYTDNKDNECMYAILDDFLVSKLDELYLKYCIKFSITDITKDVIFDEKINTNFRNYRKKSVKKEILDLIKEFKLNWVSKDDILDKILEKGINSLTSLDFSILNH